MRHDIKNALSATVAAMAAVLLPFAAEAGVRDDFRMPRGAARENTGPLFWLHGDETEARLREYVGRVAESGQGILTIESRPHVDWMRKGWWRDVDIVLDECKKRGVKMMVFDDYWWPSQGMGGKYPIPAEFQCRDVKGTVYPNEDLPDGKLANEVARVNVKEVEKGVFRVGPDGDKTIVYTWFTSNGRYRFPTVNGLDEKAVDWFIATYYQPYYDRYKAEFENGTIPGFFFDEPEFRSWWGDALAAELKARGDDAGELLTALKFRLAEPEDQARARYRYFDARAEVWGRTMYGRQSDWCRKHGVYSSGHFLEHDNCFYNHDLAGGNVMQQMKYVEVPGVDLVCRQYYPRQREIRRHQIACGQMPKYASSTAHVYNRHNGKNWCEIFGAYGQDLTYPQMKWFCDWHQYQGCYYMIPHSFNPRAPYDRDCPPYFYNGGKEPRYPLFRVWADYNNRCALMLSDGEHVCHIAQCVPGISYHAGKTIRPEMFAFAIQDAQLDSDWMMYDAVESAQIGKNPRTGRPALRTVNGKEWYDVLTLPATEYVPFPVLEKALAFAKAGGVVVGYGIMPCNTPTRGKTAGDVKRVVDAVFAQPTAFFVDGEPDGATLRAAFAKNYPGTDKPLALRAFDLPGLSAQDGRMLAVNHYVKDGAETLFIANQDIARRRDISLCAKWPLEKAELWDPMQGTIEKPVVENGRVKLALEPIQAVFLVWPKNTRKDLLPRVDANPAGMEVASAVTEVSTRMVPDGNPYAGVFAGSSWIWHPADSEAQGKVTFRAKVESAAAAASIVFICDNAATVRLNGRVVARQYAGHDNNGWRRPTRAEFNLAKGVNDIEVEAENTLPGKAGFLATIAWSGGELRTGDARWTVERVGEKRVKPLEICKFGQGVWGNVAGNATSSPFSDSVATTLSFTLPELKSGERVYLACDDVEGEKSAAVTVNGAFAGGFIGAPYRLDITKSVKAGANTLETKPFRLVRPRIVTVAAVENVAKPPSDRMDRSKLLVGAYCLQQNARTDAHVKAIRDCGVDFIIGIPATDRATLDLFAKHGVGAIVNNVVPGWWGGDGKHAGKMREVNPPEKYAVGAASFKDHPAIWAVDIGDEPSALDFPYYGDVVRQLNNALPGMPLYLNLYPNYASVSQNTGVQTVNQLGTPTYAEHVDVYCRKVPLDYISYDFYPYMADARGTDLFLSKMYDNFIVVSEACRRTKRSFWYIPQVNSRGGVAPTSENRLRFQANAALSFGAEAITWACWCAGWWVNNVLDTQGKQTVQYDRLKRVNAELKRIGPQYMRFRNVATRFVGFPAKSPQNPRGRFDRVEKLDFGPFRGLCAANGARLVVGEMVSRDPACAGRALFVTAADDPSDGNHAEFDVVFRLDGGCVAAFGGDGEIPVVRRTDGSCSVRIASCQGVLITQKGNAAACAPRPENVPELMRTFAGDVVKKKDEWEMRRAPELLERFQKDVYGRRPAVVEERGRISFKVCDERSVMGGKAVRKIVRVEFDGPLGKFAFPFTVYIPKSGRPVPALVTICLKSRSKVDAGHVITSEIWPVEQIVGRGYATAGFLTDDVATENNTGFAHGVFKCVEPSASRTDESWGAISAWAWAASRVMDWIETESAIDSAHVGVVGHSRGGKTALWTGVTDRRFALVCSNDSGAHGAKLNHLRLPKSEDIASIPKYFPNWYCRNYPKKYSGKEMAMDFDQHELLALVAPRLLCVGSASEDHWAGPIGEWWSAKLASPAWELYGMPGLVAEKYPEPGAAQQDGRISYHLRPGKHSLAPYDWNRYMDFAEKYGWMRRE